MGKHIAERTGAPTPFLLKILQQLTRERILRSNKGPTGGFALRIAPADLTLRRIVAIVDGEDEEPRCIAGFSECTDSTPCPMHDSWKPLRSGIMEYLDRTTIAALAEAAAVKRRSIEKKKNAKASGRKKS
jgi:Rrf2 family iron-sulfur cluster assembly transcriptional regulator